MGTPTHNICGRRQAKTKERAGVPRLTPHPALTAWTADGGDLSLNSLINGLDQLMFFVEENLELPDVPMHRRPPYS